MKVRAAVLVLLAGLAAAAPAHAETFTVSGVADGAGSCDGTTCTTLRAALAAASKAAGPDIINLPRTTRDAPYRVTAGTDLSVDSEVAIIGASASVVAVQGDAKSSRIFDIATTAKVTISHLKISNGAATSTDDGLGGNILLEQNANLTLDHVQVTGGTALRGGGIAMRPASTLTITQSLIDGNTATSVAGATSGDAGALLSIGNAKLDPNVLRVSDSTITQNHALMGAGIELIGNAANQTTLDRVTIAFNSGGTNTLGNGVSTNDAESIKVGSSIIAGNTGDGVPTNCDRRLTSTGGNIEKATSCGFAAPADKPGTDPQLSTILGTAGGETQVLSIPATSPAVDFAPACSGADQRDLSRPQGKSCDSGAYEVDQAPQTTITDGPTGLVNSTTATFEFTSTDAGSTFQCNLDSAGFAACSPPQTYDNLAQGAHTLGVRAIDPAGNTDPTPATASWTVDSIAPDTAITDQPPPLQSSRTASFKFTSTDSDARFQCKLDGPGTVSGTFQSCTSPATYPGLADGSYTFSAVATDVAGNADPSPAQAVFAIDGTPPAAPAITTPAGDVLQNSATVQLRGTAEANATVRVFDGSGPTPVDTTPASGTGAWTVTLSAVTDGAHAYTAKAVDAAGNVSPASGQRTVTVDTTPPAKPTITAPADNAWVNTAAPKLSGTAEAGATITVLEGTTVRGTGAADGTGAWNLQLSGVADGTHTYTATAADAATNVSAASDPKPIRVDTQAPAAPAITSPPDGSRQRDTTVTLSGTAEAGATVEVREGTSSRGTTTAGDDGRWTWAIAGVTEGTHHYTARATDAAGNPSPDSPQRTVVVDVTPPDPPQITSPAEDALLGTSQVVLRGQSEPGADVTVFDGAAAQGDATADDGGLWTLTLDDVPDGAHAYTAKATDAAGNVSTASAVRHVSTDTGPPDPPVFDTAAAIQNSSSVSLSGTAEAGAAIEVFEGDTSLGTTTANGGDWAKTLIGVADGPHTYTARARDVAGNLSALSAPHTVTVDTTAPPADVTSGPEGVTTDAVPAFGFGSEDGSARFLCRLDGPGGPGTDQECTSPHGFGTLAPGSYTFFVTAVDPAGNRTTTSRAFTVAAAQQQVSPAATPTPPPEPVFHQTVVVQPAGGKVLVRRKGSKRFVALDATQGIPLGSEVDAKHGKVELSSVPKAGGAQQTALFYGGIFVVTQAGRITQLALSEKLAACRPAKGRASAAAAKKKRKPKTRSLWGDGKGSFRTKGQYSAATVRGTKWNVRDSCTGTLTRVARGVVAVKDFARHRTKVLRAGQRYLAKPRRR